MDFPQIRIQSTNASLEMYTQQGRLSIEQPPAKLSIEQPPAEMQINRQPGLLTIDQTKAFENLNLKSVFKASEDAAIQGHRDLLDGIARRVQEGDELMKIEKGGNPIAELAKRHYLFSDHKNKGWAPSNDNVEIHFDPGKLDINWRISKPIIESQSNKPIIDYSPGRVTINLKQYPSVNIDFVNSK